MESGYGEVPSWAVREGGREGEDEKLRGSGEGSAAGRVREKKCLLVVPRRTNPNKHLLGGLDFFVLVEFKLTQTNSNTWIQTGPRLAIRVLQPPF